MTTSRAFFASIAIVGLALFAGTGAESASASVPKFKNCTAMHHVYPHGVGKPGAHDKVSGNSKPVTNFYVSTAIYNNNKSLDRDHDNIACEAH